MSDKTVIMLLYFFCLAVVISFQIYLINLLPGGQPSMLESTIFCPYCDESIEITHDEDMGTGEFYMTCTNCGRRFSYEAEIEWNFFAKEIDIDDEDGDDVANDDEFRCPTPCARCGEISELTSLVHAPGCQRCNACSGGCDNLVCPNCYLELE